MQNTLKGGIEEMGDFLFASDFLEVLNGFGGVLGHRRFGRRSLISMDRKICNFAVLFENLNVTFRCIRD